MCSNVKKSPNIINVIVCKILFFFMSLLGTLIFKNSHIFDETYIIFQKIALYQN